MDLDIFFIQFRIHDPAADRPVRVDCYDSAEPAVHEFLFIDIGIVCFPEAICGHILLRRTQV